MFTLLSTYGFSRVYTREYCISICSPSIQISLSIHVYDVPAIASFERSEICSQMPLVEVANASGRGDTCH